MRLSGLHQFLSLAWQVLLVLVSTCFVLLFVYLVLANYWPGPYEDYWIDMPLIENVFNGSSTFDQWTIAHNNSHRIVIPRLLFLADYQLASGTNTLLVCTAFLVKLALVFFFNRLLVTYSLAERLLFNTLIIMVIFNSALVYHTIFNINVQWDMMLLFSLSSVACFYHHYQARQHSMVYFTLAYLLFCCAALTHAGGFFCLPVFWLIAINQKKYTDLVLPIALFIIIFYFTFYVLTVSDPDVPTYEMMLIDTVVLSEKVFTHFFQLLSAGIYRQQYEAHIYFSIYVMTLIVFNIIAQIKIGHRESKFWLYASIFMIVVMFATSSSRVGWIWTASAYEPRFKVLSLFLLLILTLHCLTIIRHFSTPLLASAIRYCVIIHSVALILLVQSLSLNASFSMSNNNFYTHTLMLFNGTNRLNGRWLGKGVLFRQERDPVAHFDHFFKTNGYAYYNNKVLTSDEGLYVPKTGDKLVNQNMMAAFSEGCHIHTSSYEIDSNEGVDVTFSSTIDPNVKNILFSSIHRNSYFVLDANGVITGYAYIHIDTLQEKMQAFIKGFSNTGNVHYIAEISDDQPTCLYQIAP